jgi:thiamine-monophosphate kinase
VHVPTPPAATALRQRLARPAPRVALGRALRGIAHAAIDVSDGLVADLGHVLAASGVGAELAIERLPLSSTLRDAVDDDTAMRLALTGGDDYELCFTVPPSREPDLCAVARSCDLRISRIGSVVDGDGLRMVDSNGDEVSVDQRGWDHFAPAPDPGGVE